MEAPPERPSVPRRRLLISALTIIVLSMIGVVVLGVIRHREISGEKQRLAKNSDAGKRVETVEAKHSSPEKTILLIGEARPFFSVTLLARVSGFMTGLYTDIGADVKKGQLLAEVSSPETEQSYQFALADLVNKRKIADREKILLKRKLVSQQEADQAIYSADMAAANLTTQKVLLSYQKVVAPFDGRITERFLDPGALIQNASNSQSASQPLFTISQTDRLRVFVYVDQKDAPSIRVGDPVTITLPNHPETPFSAQVAQIAGQLDTKTRTLLTEIHMENREGKIVAGSFVTVQMRVRIPSYLELPVQAMVIRDKEPMVPVVQQDNTIRYTKIDLVDNDGENIRIRSGIHEGEKIALNIGSSLVDGQKVRPVPPSQAAGQAQPKKEP